MLMIAGSNPVLSANLNMFFVLESIIFFLYLYKTKLLEYLDFEFYIYKKNKLVLKKYQYLELGNINVNLYIKQFISIIVFFLFLSYILKIKFYISNFDILILIFQTSIIDIIFCSKYKNDKKFSLFLIQTLTKLKLFVYLFSLFQNDINISYFFFIFHKYILFILGLNNESLILFGFLFSDITILYKILNNIKFSNSKYIDIKKYISFPKNNILNHIYNNILFFDLFKNDVLISNMEIIETLFTFSSFILGIKFLTSFIRTFSYHVILFTRDIMYILVLPALNSHFYLYTTKEFFKSKILYTENCFFFYFIDFLREIFLLEGINKNFQLFLFFLFLMNFYYSISLSKKQLIFSFFYIKLNQISFFIFMRTIFINAFFFYLFMSFVNTFFIRREFLYSFKSPLTHRFIDFEFFFFSIIIWVIHYYFFVLSENNLIDKITQFMIIRKYLYLNLEGNKKVKEFFFSKNKNTSFFHSLKNIYKIYCFNLNLKYFFRIFLVFLLNLMFDINKNNFYDSVRENNNEYFYKLKIFIVIFNIAKRTFLQLISFYIYNFIYILLEQIIVFFIHFFLFEHKILNNIYSLLKGSNLINDNKFFDSLLKKPDILIYLLKNFFFILLHFSIIIITYFYLIENLNNIIFSSFTLPFYSRLDFTCFSILLSMFFLYDNQ